jgi:hypothetical protein
MADALERNRNEASENESAAPTVVGAAASTSLLSINKRAGGNSTNGGRDATNAPASLGHCHEM